MKTVFYFVYLFETFYYFLEWFGKPQGDTGKNNDLLRPARPTGVAGTQLRRM